MTIRDSLARNLSGGPPFRIRADRIILEASTNGGLRNELEDSVSERKGILDSPPINLNALARIEGEAKRLGFNTKRLNNLGVVVAEAPRLDNVIDNISETRSDLTGNIQQELKSVRRKAARQNDKTVLGGWTPGNLDFFAAGDEGYEESDASIEAKLRNELTDVSLQNPVTEALSNIDNVVNAELGFTRTTYGPRNLNVDVDDLQSFFGAFEDTPDSEVPDLPGVPDARKKIGVDKAWETTRGEDVVIAVFDTSFYSDFLKSDRVISTFSGDDVASAYSDPEEGHGTMCAVSAAGNVEDGAPVNGVAPDAELMLARITDSSGAMPYVEEAWDWLIGQIKQTDKPVISTHSYGVPLCSGRTMDLCDATTTKVVAAANKRVDHQSFHAAGNEAMYCGHRLVGATNGIMGTNSLPSTITVGANRFDLVDAQRYSSHGFGTCSGLSSNPKPDVSCLIPSLIPYGTDVKDMSTGQGGSSGGTSEATPLTAGVGALIASVTGDARRGNIEDVLESTAELPRPTQTSVVLGFDARFGRGQIRADKAVDEIVARTQV